LIDVKALVSDDVDYLRSMVQSIIEATLEAEMMSAPGAGKGERAGRLRDIGRRHARPAKHRMP